VNGTLFLSASNGTSGPELWKSDGTAAGTLLVRELTGTITGNSDPAKFFNANGTLYFSAWHRSHRLRTLEERRYGRRHGHGERHFPRGWQFGALLLRAQQRPGLLRRRQRRQRHGTLEDRRTAAGT
jgi:ELWxxDGT repeat protein